MHGDAHGCLHAPAQRRPQDVGNEWEIMRLRGQKGGNEATSIVFMSAPCMRIDVDRFLDQASTVKIFHGEEIEAVCKDDDDIYMYYVISGALEVGTHRGDEWLTVFYIRSDDNAVVCAREGFLTYGSNRFVLKAVSNTVLAGFTFRQIKKFMQTDEAFLDSYLNEVHMAMAQMGHRIDTVSHQSSSRRILLWLEKLCEANEPDSDGVYRVPCNLTVDELAGLLLIHYATCNKLLKSLKERGIINKTRTHLEISDCGQLEELLLVENPVLY